MRESDIFPAADPPEDTFRIRLVITLLQTCGGFFNRGPAKRKLDRFLSYFQRYILSKPGIPVDQARVRSYCRIVFAAWQ